MPAVATPKLIETVVDDALRERPAPVDGHSSRLAPALLLDGLLGDWLADVTRRYREGPAPT